MMIQDKVIVLDLNKAVLAAEGSKCRKDEGTGATQESGNKNHQAVRVDL